MFRDFWSVGGTEKKKKPPKYQEDHWQDESELQGHESCVPGVYSASIKKTVSSCKKSRMAVGSSEEKFVFTYFLDKTMSVF